MNITDKIALVTGGASGLGRATVRQLAANGAGVVIVDLPSSNGKDVADELGEKVVFVPAAVTTTRRSATPWRPRAVWVRSVWRSTAPASPTRSESWPRTAR